MKNKVFEFQTNKNQKDRATGKAYASSREYMADELRRLDLFLKRYLVGGEQLEEANRFDGLVLSAEEVCGLLDEGVEEGDWIDQLAQLESTMEQRLEASRCEGIPLSLPTASKLLGLGALEQQCIILCLAPEVNRKYEKIYGYLQNDVTAKSPTIDFALQLLVGSEEEKIAARHIFDQQGPMMRFMMETGGSVFDSRIPLIARSLKLDDWVVHYLLGLPILDARLMNVAQMVFAGPIEDGTPLSCVEENVLRFVSYYRNKSETKPKQVFYFYGPEGAGKKSYALRICNQLGISLILADIEEMLVSEMPFNEILRLLGRQLMLGDNALCLEGFESLLVEDGRYQGKVKAILEMVTSYAPLTFILGQTPWNLDGLDEEATFVKVGFTYPEDKERKGLWEAFGQQHLIGQEVDLEDLAGKFRFTPGQIRAIFRHGENLAVWNRPEQVEIGLVELYDACHTHSNRKLSTMAPKMNPNYSWDMLVLPTDQKAQLKEICNQVKYRSIVYGDWGFAGRLSLGKGLNVLFSGPPGSGKTMAAEVVAKELGLEIYKIDVSQIISKYIGETEKNLAKIFAEAETSNAILFFDEADALFGKRSEVKDAHDRYANVETSYLLQKMEEYTGIVILATNFNQNIDEAFLRRLHFNVEFPFPEKEQRNKIWVGMFPAGAPLDPDIDYGFMAEKFILAGGNIKNIALSAAFYAANEACPIGMKQIMQAAKREYKKLGKTFLKSDFSPYDQLLEVN